MIADMIYSKITSFLGRNGNFKQSGINIFDTDDTIYLTPITSKGDLGRCEISIPKEDVSRLIAQLQKIK